MKKFFYLVLVICSFTLIPQILLAQTPYFDKHLDEYKPHLVSDMVPKELLNFKPVSFKFYGTTITEIKAKTKDGSSRKSDEKESGKLLHFEWQFKGRLVSLDYYVVSWDDAQKHFGGKKVHPNVYAYLRLVEDKIQSVCLTKDSNCPHLFVDSSLPEEHQKCDFYANPDKINTIPNQSYHYIYQQCSGAGNQRHYGLYVGLWSYANVFIKVHANDLNILKQIGNSAVDKLKSAKVE